MNEDTRPSRLTAGLFSSTTDLWATPQAFFDKLNAEFHFDLDAASTDENALCERHYTKAQDGLRQPWSGAVWCNPPYGREIGKWVRKAATDNDDGVSVLLVPARTDTSWWHDWIVGHASEVRFLRGRLRFGDSSASAPFPSAVVVYDKRPRRYWAVK
jgi:site-specific DNA-methyltransferase (adenine-specific)